MAEAAYLLRRARVEPEALLSLIQWEYDLVEKPCCEQLKAMGSQWIEGDTEVPELTDLLTGRIRVPELEDGRRCG